MSEIPTWPTELPGPTRAGYQRSRQDGRAPKRGNGPQGYRRKFVATAKLLSLVIELTRSQKAVFDQFYDVQTADGSLAFYMPDPATDGWRALTSDGQPMLMPDGTPILLSKRLVCLFGQTPPSERMVRSEFEISFSVQVMP